MDNDGKLDSTEEKIVFATFNLLQKEGVSKTTTKKIADAAGVNEVTIFRKFGNKNHLIEITKNYFLEKFLDKLNDVFDFREDEEIEEYMENNFRGMLNLTDEDFSIIKISLEEVRGIHDRKLLISQITETILQKIAEFYTLQIEKGKIRDIDVRVLSIMSLSITFQSVVLWRVYDKTPSLETEQFSENLLDIIYNGIKD